MSKDGDTFGAEMGDWHFMVVAIGSSPVVCEGRRRENRVIEYSFGHCFVSYYYSNFIQLSPY